MQNFSLPANLTIPLMGALLVASVGSGQLVSRTGRYKWMPIAGSVLVAVALLLLSTPGQPPWEICAYLAAMGVGLGLSMQILVLILRGSFPLREVGTSTASNNFCAPDGLQVFSPSVCPSRQPAAARRAVRTPCIRPWSTSCRQGSSS